MKQKILTLTLLLCATMTFAQELKVKSFIHNEMNLEARIGGGRTDLNGKQCALIKVMVRDNIVKCKGGNIGDIVTEGVVKKIFVSPSTKFLEFEFQYNFPLKVTFADYGIQSLSEGGTYTITLVDANVVILSNPNVLPIEVNGQTFNMIKVEGGIFTMGGSPEMIKADNDEKPAHKVTLSTYYIGETEVTQELWKAVMGNNPSYFKGNNLPVESISWNDCQTFIRKLNNLTGKYFRLPTEAEWEFAARGGNNSALCQYSGNPDIDKVAWYGENSGKKPHPVASKTANQLGLYDMSGNVWEWCQDWKGSYTIDDKIDPAGPSNGSFRINRGGCWGSNAWFCRSSTRCFIAPDGKRNYIGFRLALSKN